MTRSVRLWRAAAKGLILLLLRASIGCSSRATGGNPKRAAAPPESGQTDTGSSFGINLQCEAERILNAPAPFHWSYRRIVPPMTTDWEADITPFSILGSVTDGSGTRLIHATRSEKTNWNTSVAILTDALPGSAFALVNNSSAIVRAGNQTAYGKDIIRYTVDTSRDLPADAALIRSVLGPNGFVKGTVWVNAMGCPMKFSLDVQQHYDDGTLHKEHYEVSATQP